MPKVIYTGPGEFDEIDGVKYTKHPDGKGLVSADISEEAAARLATIPGFEVVGAKKASTAVNEETPEEKEAREKAEAELEAARARAKELGVDVKGNWKIERLRAEIDKAEKVANTDQK